MREFPQLPQPATHTSVPDLFVGQWTLRCAKRLLLRLVSLSVYLIRCLVATFICSCFATKMCFASEFVCWFMYLRFSSSHACKIIVCAAALAKCNLVMWCFQETNPCLPLQDREHIKRLSEKCEQTKRGGISKLPESFSEIMFHVKKDAWIIPLPPSLFSYSSVSINRPRN